MTETASTFYNGFYDDPMGNPNMTDDTPKPGFQPINPPNYSDILKKQRSRTWAYGTQKKVKVIFSKPGVMICADDAKEGYVLLGTDSDEAKENDTGVITFTQGGPFGGYWRFRK